MYCSHFGDSFNGVCLEHLPKIVDFCSINIVRYTLKDHVASSVQRSRMMCGETLKLNMYQNHLSLIEDFDLYCAVFQCKTPCAKLWCGRKHYLRHCKTCTARVDESYLGGIFTRPLQKFFKSWWKLMFLFPKQIFITRTLHATTLNVF